MKILLSSMVYPSFHLKGDDIGGGINVSLNIYFYEFLTKTQLKEEHTCCFREVVVKRFILYKI
jgi:hypothetical protein